MTKPVQNILNKYNNIKYVPIICCGNLNMHHINKYTRKQDHCTLLDICL